MKLYEIAYRLKDYGYQYEQAVRTRQSNAALTENSLPCLYAAGAAGSGLHPLDEVLQPRNEVRHEAQGLQHAALWIREADAGTAGDRTR